MASKTQGGASGAAQAYGQGFPSVLDFTSGPFFDSGSALSPRGSEGGDGQSAPIPTPESQASVFESKFLSRFGISPDDLATSDSLSVQESGSAVASPAFSSSPNGSAHTGAEDFSSAYLSPSGAFQEFSPLFGSIPAHSPGPRLDAQRMGRHGLEELDPRFDEVVSPMFDYDHSPRGRTDSDLEPFSLGSAAVHVARSAGEERFDAAVSPTAARPILEKAKELRTKQGGPRKKKGKEKGKEHVKLSLQEFHSISGATAQPQPYFEMDEGATPVLWIGNIGPQVTEKELLDEFGEFGNLVNLRILRDRYCAFITFDRTEAAVKAKRALDGEIFGSQYIVIHYRQMGGPPAATEAAVTNPPSNSLWVGNISDGVSKADLLEEFGKFGIIESIRLLRNCAFVNFSSVEEATNALETLQGKLIGHMHLKINYGKMRANTLSTSPVQIPAELLPHEELPQRYDVASSSSPYLSRPQHSPEEYPTIGGSPYSPHLAQSSPHLRSQPSPHLRAQKRRPGGQQQQFPALASPPSPSLRTQAPAEPQQQQQHFLQQQQELEQRRLQQQRRTASPQHHHLHHQQQQQMQQQMQRMQVRQYQGGEQAFPYAFGGQSFGQGGGQGGQGGQGGWGGADLCACGRLPRSFLLFPCNHSFCGECLTGTPHCPYCGSAIRSCEPYHLAGGEPPLHGSANN